MANAVRSAAALIVIVVVGQAACQNPAAQRAHEEMIAIHEGVRPGMRPSAIEEIFNRVKPQHLRYAGIAWNSVRIDQVVPEGGAKEWVLWISLKDGGAAAVRIRTKDSELEHPSGAPLDTVWAEEDEGTPFKNPMLR